MSWNDNNKYDGGVNTFSPEGRIHQVEYAQKAVANGALILGLQTKEGIILGVEKTLHSPLIEPASIEKIHQIDEHLCAASCGIVSDSRALIDKARVESQNHFFTFNEIIPSFSVAETIGDTILGFGKGKDMPSRPFGVALLIAGCDDDKGPQLFLTNPTGNVTEWKAKAVGTGSDNAQEELEKGYKETLSLEEGKLLILKILKQNLKEKIDSNRVELAVVVRAKIVHERFERISADEVNKLLKALD